jgi:uncharacterized metal-binding protein YceD (DUF177 family)
LQSVFDQLAMDPLKAYAIPLKSLRNGVHEYRWTLGGAFFEHFEASPIRKGNFEVQLLLDKQNDLSTLQITIEGKYRSVCDRCLADIEIPVCAQHLLYVKSANEKVADPSLICLSPTEQELRLAGILYESICLSLPISQTIDCGAMENPPCDQEVLSRIDRSEGFHADDSAWDPLKKLEQ